MRYSFGDGRVSEASHLPPLISRSAKLGKPTLMTLRNPIDSVASWMVATGCDPKHGFDFYNIFHRSTARALHHGVYLADFESLVTLDEKFVLEIDSFFGEKVEGCKDVSVEDVIGSLRSEWDPNSNILTVPSEKKRALKADAMDLIEAEKGKKHFKEATKIYELLIREFEERK